MILIYMFKIYKIRIRKKNDKKKRKLIQKWMRIAENLKKQVSKKKKNNKNKIIQHNIFFFVNIK